MREFDVLIAGSGPSGVCAAWPLVDAGLKVAMVDGGGGLPPSAPSASWSSLRSNPQRWQYFLGGEFDGLTNSEDLSPKFQAPLGRFVMRRADEIGPALKTDGFFATRSSTAGGLSTIWGALCSAFDHQDLTAFPIGEDDLHSAYRAIAGRIGLSGVDDALGGFHGRSLPLQEPVPLGAPLKILADRYERLGGSPEVLIGRARNAVITQSKAERQACNQCGLCLLGCGKGSIYSSLQDLNSLKCKENFTYIIGGPVLRFDKVGLGKCGYRVHLRGGETLFANKLILATGTINSTALLSSYLGSWNQPLRILSNPVASLAFWIPSLTGANFPEVSFALGQLTHRIALDDAGSYATGVMYGALGVPLFALADRLPVTRQAALRISAALAPSLVLATVYLPGRYSQNELRVGIKGGAPEISIRGETLGAARSLLAKASAKLASALRRYGAYRVPGSLTYGVAGADAHLAGTVPMGGSGPLACSTECEVVGAPGVHIVDGAWLPDLPAKHYTFTLMANAHRVGAILASRLKSHE